MELSTAYANLHLSSTKLQKIRTGALASASKTDKRPRGTGLQRLGEAEARELVDAYQSGALIKELSAKFGVHRVTVTALLRRRGVHLRRVGMSDQQVVDAARLYREGWALTALSQKYGVDESTVRRYLMLAGVTLRRPWERG